MRPKWFGCPIATQGRSGVDTKVIMQTKGVIDEQKF